MKKLFSVVAVMGLAALVGSFEYKKGISNSSVDIEEPQTVLNPDGSKMYFAPVIIIKPPRECDTFGFTGLREGLS
ncbi:hypothetical protein [Sessilibacter corallicola]|uniref:Uncharacterized protein n=1 Tax=Sessilibacter corallicola TaxID=2904075 RepID=A0ABQ0AA29_9GAMM